MTSKAFTLTVEPVGTCNLDCSYCYASKDAASHLDADLVLQSLGQISQYAADKGFEEVHCVWLGGEPLLAGHGFFERVGDWTATTASRIRIRHFMQTNGLLLDAAYCRLLRDAGVHLGLSLDGPQPVHDAFRRTRQGARTFSRVMDAVGLLRQHAAPFGCVAVVTRMTLGREQEVYDFFCDLGCGFRINPVIPSPETAARFARITPEEYGGSLVRFFDAWSVPRPDRVNVSPLDNYVVSLLGGELQECQQQPSCARHSLGLKPNGDVVRCGRFQDMALGNLKETSLDALLADRASDPFRDRAAARTSCRGCLFWPQCHGGCPHNALVFGGDLAAKDPFCAAYTIIFSHIKHALSL
jgi:uncharacterized protein